MLGPQTPETRDPVACPKCGNIEIADVSPHVFFVDDALGIKCRKCKHVWKAARSEIPFVSSYEEKLQAGAQKGFDSSTVK